MKHGHTLIFDVRITKPPTVEFDSEAGAAYVRFSSKPVARTLPVETSTCLVTVDQDSDGEVIGVELVGVSEFRIDALLKAARVKPIPSRFANRASYVPAGSALQVV